MGVGRLVARSGRALWATVRILHFTLSEVGVFGTSELWRDRI